MAETPVTTAVRFIQLGLLILFAVPSSICTAYVLYSFVCVSSFRQRFQNHTLVFIVSLIGLNILCNGPILLGFFSRGHVWPRKEALCVFWKIMDYISTLTILWSTAIFTLERYALVFHPKCLRSGRQKLLFHYLPLILVNTYVVLFQVCTHFFYRCDPEPKLDFEHYLCGDNCLDKPGTLQKFNWIVHILLPVALIIFGSLALLIRVLWTRRAMQRNQGYWLKNRRMIVQLLGMAVVYSIIWLPYSVLSTIDTFDENDLYHNLTTGYLDYGIYLLEMTIPIVALLLWPELRSSLWRCFRGSTASAPSTIPLP